MKKFLSASMIGCLGLLWCLGCETGEDLESDADLFASEEDSSDDLSSRATSVGLYQAEKFTAQSGCKIATNQAGYTGTSFVDFGGNGTWIEFNNVNVAQAGSYTLNFRFATAAGSRQCAITINGANVGNVSFSATGSWTKWGTANLTKSLKAGSNTIRILANTSSGGPNLDSMEVLSNIVDPGGTSLCVEAAENKAAALSCPAGKTIASINFASYGLPTGACPGGFATGTCHATSSLDKVKAACLNKQSCSVAASNGVFGDPCSGKAKKLAVVYTCSGGTADNCPNDPNKTEPGLCGCGVPEGSCASCKNTLAVNERLSAGQYRCSADGRFKFGMSSGGNLALLEGAKTLWSANTCCGAAFVIMQGDGNLVVYDSSSAKWSSRTAGKSGASLTVENNGTAVIRYNGSILWSVGSSAPVDNCPNDPNKTEPGKCGCGVPEGTCSNPTGELKIVIFSVRSADSALIVFPTGKTMLVDSATSNFCTKEVLPFLRRHGVNHLDYYVETHPHPDHVGGKDLLMASGHITGTTKIWDWKTYRYENEFQLEGTKWFISNAFDRDFNGTDTNRNSLSFRLEYQGFIYSASGDQADNSQNRFLKDHPNLVAAHVRNTAHHMYGPVSREFLVATNPYLFIISNASLSDSSLPSNFRSAVKQLQSSGGRLKEYVTTGNSNVGHVVIRASNAQTWSYKFCPNTTSCLFDYIP